MNIACTTAISCLVSAYLSAFVLSECIMLKQSTKMIHGIHRNMSILTYVLLYAIPYTAQDEASQETKNCSTLS